MHACLDFGMFVIVRGRRGLMVMALDCSAGGRELKPGHFQNIFNLMARFDRGDEKRFDNHMSRNRYTKQYMESCTRGPLIIVNCNAWNVLAQAYPSR